MLAKRILLIKVRGLGDTLLATPALRALRQAWPDSHITMLVSAAGQAVLPGNPNVNEVWVYHKSQAGLRYSLQLVRRMARQRFDLAIALHASFRTALLALLSGARRRVVDNHSGSNYFATIPITVKKEAKSSIQRDLDAIRALGIPDAGEQTEFYLRPEDEQAAQVFLREQGLQAGKFMVFAPGSTDPRRRWSVEAGTAFLEAGRLQGLNTWALLCGPDDQALTTAIQQRVSFHPPVFQGSLQAAGALLQAGQGLVTVNSGPKHIAVALGVKTLTLWTNEPEAEWHPYPRQQHALLRSRTGEIGDIPVDAVVQTARAHFGLS